MKFPTYVDESSIWITGHSKDYAYEINLLKEPQHVMKKTHKSIPSGRRKGKNTRSKFKYYDSIYR